MCNDAVTYLESLLVGDEECMPVARLAVLRCTVGQQFAAEAGQLMISLRLHVPLVNRSSQKAFSEGAQRFPNFQAMVTVSPPRRREPTDFLRPRGTGLLARP